MSGVAPADLGELRDAIGEALIADEPVELISGATKRGLGRPLQLPRTLDLSGLAGIRDYQSSELVLTAGAATPLDVIETALAQAGQMLAALLGIGQATFVSKLELLDNNAKARCGRETDAGIETMTVKLPAIITTDLRLNEPRYVSLPGIMKAKKKPLEEISLSDLGIEAISRTKVLSLEPPPRRKAGVRVKTVDDLVDKLKHEAKVL